MDFELAASRRLSDMHFKGLIISSDSKKVEKNSIVLFPPSPIIRLPNFANKP
jgi:hypothetical protein